jgi:hypothetical protein
MASDLLPRQMIWESGRGITASWSYLKGDDRVAQGTGIRLDMPLDATFMLPVLQLLYTHVVTDQ